MQCFYVVRWIMNNIENTYANYEEIVSEFKREVIQSRFEQIYEEMKAFIKRMRMEDEAKINAEILMQSLLDYFSDVYRLKKYQKISHTNGIKIKAYETFWLVQRKPIQLTADELNDDRNIYINEKFALSRLISYLLGDRVNMPIVEEKQKAFQNFLDTLYYYLKFRRCDPQSIELMILAFKAGQLLGDEKTEEKPRG